MAPEWTTRQQALTLGRAGLLLLAFAVATACAVDPRLSRPGVVLPGSEVLALDVPEHCSAERTSSGYTISCEQEVASAPTSVSADLAERVGADP